jgi:hypothetical protein
MKFKMGIFMPNKTLKETLKGFYPPIKYDDNAHDQ